MEGAFISLFAVFVISAGMISLAVWADKLTLFAPRGSRGLKGPVQHFCLECRNADGSCPLHLEPRDCPVWQFVEQDRSVNEGIDPSQPVRGINLATR